MGARIEFNKEEQELLCYLYREKLWRIKKIANLFGISKSCMSRKLKEYGIRNERYNDIYCKICKKRVTPNCDGQLYCKECQPLARRISEEKRGQLDRYYVYNQLRWLRSQLYMLVRKNPYKALEIREKMIEEEGEEFTEKTIGTVFKDPFFKEMKKSYDLLNSKKKEAIL